MLGSSPGSPFRTGTNHRAPWPPPSHHAAEGFGRYGVSGGLYSLFPGSADTSATIYSQATSAARFSHSNTYHSFIGSHKVADSLFSTGYAFGGPTPPPSNASGPPFTPLVERGITQLELMAKGFNNNNNANNNNSNNNHHATSNSNNNVESSGGVALPATKKSESKRRADCSLYQQDGVAMVADRRGAAKRRWERDSQPASTPPVVKSEVVSRPSCGCRRSNIATGSPSAVVVQQKVADFQHQQHQHHQQHQQHHQHQHQQHQHHLVVDDRKKQDGGCSRTTPVSLRAAPATSAADWFGAAGVVIKKEPATGGGTPCQVAEVSTSLRHSAATSTAASLSPLTAVIKVEGGRKDAASLHTQHLAVNTVSSIPVGIAVARQRLQDAASKPPPPQTLVLAPAPEQPPPRPQKTLAPAPELAAADLASAPLSAMVLQPQCEDRVANGIAPWAATTTHNPALTPPTLWQYPASVPVQLGPTEHLPLPPVGYQLVRDPISGHFLLIPTTNIEHLQRTVLWPSYPATIQPSLPATQHIQLFESAEPAEYSAQTARILVQPQLTITAAPAPVDTASKRKPTVIKIEDCSGAATVVDGSTAIVKSHHHHHPASRSAEVSVATNTVSVPVLSSGTTTVTPVVSQFFYDHSTAVVQLAQTPQPSASVQTDNGKRSQATSPVNPAETCLTPPPETGITHLESEDASATSLVVPLSADAPVQVQDASNQTDTPPISEDEICDVGGVKLLSLDPPADLLQQLPVVQLPLPPPPPPPPPPVPPQVSAPVVDVPQSLPQTPVTPHPVKETEERRSEADSPVKQTDEMVDLSGLELLSNSIEQFENIHHKTAGGPVQPADSKMLPEPAAVPVIAAARGGPSSGSTEDSAPGVKKDGDLGPSVEKAAETLQLLCQQSAQMKKLEEEPTPAGGADGCDKPLVEVSDKVKDGKDKRECKDNEVRAVDTGESGSNMLGGLGLLCALAEQRFMEEVASSEPKSSVVTPPERSISSDNPAFSGHDPGTASGVDVNRNYRTRESERECKKFIASKVLQYYQNGNRSGSSSPQHSHTSLLSGICTSPSSADYMDAMELDMRMRLAELQRKYREKQRELSKLTPKKPGSESGSSSVTSPEAPSTGGSSHQAKRGPGRPRKKCNKLVLDSPPLSPPSGGSCTKFRSSKSSCIKPKDSSRDPPPPVLEKVTDIQRPRPRFDPEDCVAPKLKASRLDILKPPTLTANKILTCAKFKPAASSGSNADRGLKLPQCNVNLVKLNNGQQDSGSEKDATGKLPKSSAITTDSNKGKLSPLSFTDGSSTLDKLSAFTSGRLPLMHAPSHTFGSKPSTCLLGAGETESLFWFKTTEKSSCFGKLSDRSSPEVENSGSTTTKLKTSSTPPPLSPPVATFGSSSPVDASTLSSSKKRKVGRPKKHLSMAGCELTTETIVAKKPKSKSNLVGLLLSKNRHSVCHTSLPKPVASSPALTLFKPIANGSGPEQTLSFSKLSSNAKSTAAENLCTFSKPFATASLKTVAGGGNASSDVSALGGKSAILPAVFKAAASKSGAGVGQKKNGSVAATDLCAADGHKPNKIRPKLKAEAKVKTWSWGEDEDAVAIDWPMPTQEKNQSASVPVQAQAWTKKPEKVEKTEKAVGGPGRPPNRKLGVDVKPAVAPKGPKKGPVAGAKGKEKRSSSSEKKEDAPAPSPAKKQRRNNSSCHSSGGGTSESEDLPLSMLSRNQATCVLTQAHLNVDKQRALTVMGGLFYAGTISAIRAPDVYGITLDGERGNRPHIFSREEILRDAILEVRVTKIETLTPGTRLCAYWSQQYRCLYPGTVAEPSSPDSELDDQFVSVEFDDGDNGRINVDDIRLLPVDYPIVEYDPNPLLTLGKRRRRNSGTSCESHSKDRRTSSEVSTPAASSSTGSKAAEEQSAGKYDGAKGQEGSSAQCGTVLDGDSRCDAPPSSRSDHKAADDAPHEGKKSRLEVEEQNKDDSSDLSSRERKRLKKRRREKLKRLLTCSGVALSLDGAGKKRHKKHRCGEDHSRHKRHHRRHRRHKHRHGSRNKDSSGGSSGESSSKTSIDADTSSRLSPVLEQLDILEIQQTALRQLQASGQARPNQEDGSTTTPRADAADDTGTPERGPNLAMSDTSTPTAPAETKKGKKDKETAKAKKVRDRQPSVESRSKMAAFLPARQLWGWSGRGFKRPGAKGRGKKEFFKAIQRGKETIRVGDCAVFLSTGRPDRPYIGRIESMWESWGTNMVVRVKWFYHPEETNGCTVQLKYPGALFESPHVDENDVQTISHKCEVLPLSGYTERLGSEPQRYSTIYDNNDIYYLAGYYDPTTSQLTMEPGIL